MKQQIVQPGVSPISGTEPPRETRWKKGGVGNPGGIPKTVYKCIKLARAACPEAYERLVYWMRSDNYKASIPATLALIERGHGKVMTLDEMTTKRAKADEDEREQNQMAGLTEDQQARIFAIIQEGKNV